MERRVKEAFCVIGREGSTGEGAGFVQRLWKEANERYGEIAPLVRMDENGGPAGFWGAMSGPERDFAPWADGFTRGLYLAGAEVRPDAEPPEGWVKWTVPGYEYVVVKAEGEDSFAKGLRYIEENGLTLAGAVNDFMNPKEDGQPYMYFPIRKL